jgi:hypothetical protein
MPVPLHLAGSRMELAPRDLCEFACRHGVAAVFFVDDAARCRNSVRADSDIFINARCTFWANMIPPPFSCQDAAEAVLLRALHEIGHVKYEHIGDAALESTPSGLSIERTGTFFERTFMGQEGAAWKFALRLRADDPEEYARLHDACSRWLADHDYADMDWDPSARDQWRRIRGIDLTKETFSLPDWVKLGFT